MFPVLFPFVALLCFLLTLFQHDCNKESHPAQRTRKQEAIPSRVRIVAKDIIMGDVDLKHAALFIKAET